MASKDGNRETHYRGTALGVTLVNDLSCFAVGVEEEGGRMAHGWGSTIPRVVQVGSTVTLKQACAVFATRFLSLLPFDHLHLSSVLQAFRHQVDLELPGLFSWFSDSSLHITVRALLG